MNESILNLIFKDVIAAYRNNPNCDVKIYFNPPAFDRLRCITRSDELDIIGGRFLGIPFELQGKQKELYKVIIQQQPA